MNNCFMLVVLVFFCLADSRAQTTNEGLPKSWTDKGVASQMFQYKLPKFDLVAQQQEDALNDATWAAPWRFGYKHVVNYSLQNSGTWSRLKNGDRIWRIALHSKDALTMNILFDDFYLPKGATVYLYNPITKEVRGAYTHDNNNEDRKLGSTLLSGDELVVEYYEPARVAGQGALTIGAVVHGYRSVGQFPKTRLTKDLNDAGNCNYDVKCPLGNGWQQQINAVAMIIVNGDGICTGALINNTRNDGTPYFLSANHCGTNRLSTWVFRFNWDSPVPSCAQNSSSQVPTGAYNEVNGAIGRAHNADSDFSLMELMTAPTGAVYYAGWDRRPIAATQTTGIHHAKGDVKKICRDNNPPISSTFPNGIEVWRIVDWEQGVTEPASSGSPLFNQNHLIVGQLYGGAAACVGLTDNNKDDNYGRFDVSWDGASSSTRLKDWLDPTGSNVDVLMGYNPNTAPLALDAGLRNIQGINENYCNVNTIAPTVVIENSGTDTITSLQIQYNIDGAPNATYNWTGNLESYGNRTITLPAINVDTGSHALSVTVRMPNNAVDSNYANNSIVRTFNVSTGNPFTYYLVQDCYGSETTWTLSNSFTGTILYAGGPYNNNYTTIDTLAYEFCLPFGCYDFEIMDSYGDGLYASSPRCGHNGDYWITDASGNEVVRMNAVNGNFDSSAVHNFCTTGLNTNVINLANSIDVFPNPTQDLLAIQITMPQRSDIKIELYNATGQVLQQIAKNEVSNDRIELDLSNYGAGLYLVVLKTKTQVVTKKVIKQ